MWLFLVGAELVKVVVCGDLLNRRRGFVNAESWIGLGIKPLRPKIHRQAAQSAEGGKAKRFPDERSAAFKEALWCDLVLANVGLESHDEVLLTGCAVIALEWAMVTGP